MFATYLSANNADFPTFINFLNYGCLALFILFRVVTTENGILTFRSIKLKIPWGIYVLAALLDVEANYLVLNAYNYTSITSIMLLDCFTIPCAMALSKYFLKAQYKRKHICGIVLCVIGLILIVLSDVLQNGYQEGTVNDAFLGDIYCLCGSALYASSNVLQESLVKVKSQDSIEYLGMLGFFGSLIAFVQFMIVDLRPMREFSSWDMEVILFIVGFVVCLFFMYVNTSSFLQMGDSTFFNLSLLTSDVYAVCFAYITTGKLVNWLYFIAFACVAVGLYIYYSEKNPVTAHDLLLEEESRRRREIDEEVGPSI